MSYAWVVPSVCYCLVKVSFSKCNLCSFSYSPPSSSCVSAVVKDVSILPLLVSPPHHPLWGHWAVSGVPKDQDLPISHTVQNPCSTTFWLPKPIKRFQSHNSQWPTNCLSRHLSVFISHPEFPEMVFRLVLTANVPTEAVFVLVLFVLWKSKEGCWKRRDLYLSWDVLNQSLKVQVLAN